MQLRQNDEIVINKLSASQRAIHESPSTYDWQLALDGSAIDSSHSERVLVINKLSINLQGASSRRHPAMLTSRLRDKLNAQTALLAQQALHVSDTAASQSPAVYFNDHVEWVVSFIVDKFKGEHPWYWQSIEENNLPVTQSICQTLCNNGEFLAEILERLNKQALAVPILKSLSDFDIQQLLLQLQRRDIFFNNSSAGSTKELKNKSLNDILNCFHDNKILFKRALIPFTTMLAQCFSTAQIHSRSIRCEMFLTLFSTLIWQRLPSQLKQAQTHQYWLTFISDNLCADNIKLSSTEHSSETQLIQSHESALLAVRRDLEPSNGDKSTQHHACIIAEFYHSHLSELNTWQMMRKSTQIDTPKYQVLYLKIRQVHSELRMRAQLAQNNSVGGSQSTLHDFIYLQQNVINSELNNETISNALLNSTRSSKGEQNFKMTQPVQARAVIDTRKLDLSAFAPTQCEFYSAVGGVFYLLHVLNNTGCQALIDQEQLQPWHCIYYLSCHFQVPFDAPLLNFFKEQLKLDEISELKALPALSIKAQYLLPIYLFEQFPLSKEIVSALLCKRSRVTLSQRHLDIYFHSSAIDINARLSGLDINPGWIPMIEMVVNYHYQEDSYLLNDRETDAASSHDNADRGQ